jgi:hypothetical protein
MKNLKILLEDRPGALAEMGETLGRVGVSIEGGGMFVVDGKGIRAQLFDMWFARLSAGENPHAEHSPTQK